MKNWKHASSTSDFLDFTITDRDSWAAAKDRMMPTEDRVDGGRLEREYRTWRRRGCWIEGHGWFGYDALASWAVGTERMLIALADDPAWCRDMFDHALSVNLALLEMVWDRGYTFDAFKFCDDLGYRSGLFFSPETYRRVLKPVHKRAFDWAHNRGV